MKKRLKDIAEIRTGYGFRGKVTPDPIGKVPVIQIKDIDSDYRIRVSDLVAVNLDRPEPHQTTQGDVLFLGRGHRLYPVEVPAVGPNTIATGYFFILRPNTRVVLPQFLAWSLKQPDFQKSLRPYHKGTHMPMINLSDLENLTIQVPPLDLQRRILALNELLDQERRLAGAIQEKRNLLVHAVCYKLMLDS